MLCCQGLLASAHPLANASTARRPLGVRARAATLVELEVRFLHVIALHVFEQSQVSWIPLQAFGW